MAQSLLSPENDTFATPPSTPGLQNSLGHPGPSLSRKSSRPSSLVLEHEWKPDIVVEEHSPVVSRKANGNMSGDLSLVTPKTSGPSPSVEPLKPNLYQRPIDSPCFVHSYLDKGASLTDWLRTKHSNVFNGNNDELSIVKSLQRKRNIEEQSVIENVDGEDEEGTGNLTTKLVETAVGVREMSKQLG